MKKVIDHSKTYKNFSFKNIPHRSRLRTIQKYIKKYPHDEINSFADIGCSNGYITNILCSILPNAKPTGLDKSDNIKKARSLHPHISFEYLDLNYSNEINSKYDLVTCFETLEHVGSIEKAMENITNLSRKFVLLSVPIEHGLVGIFKYLIKRFIYRYKLELNCSDIEYIIALLKNKDISVFREQKAGYGSHFGFNYQIIDKFLLKNKISFYAENRLTTRFYIINIHM